jgi:hypothetical protein
VTDTVFVGRFLNYLRTWHSVFFGPSYFSRLISYVCFSLYVNLSDWRLPPFSTLFYRYFLRSTENLERQIGSGMQLSSGYLLRIHVGQGFAARRSNIEALNGHLSRRSSTRAKISNCFSTKQHIPKIKRKKGNQGKLEDRTLIFSIATPEVMLKDYCHVIVSRTPTSSPILSSFLTYVLAPCIAQPAPLRARVQGIYPSSLVNHE